MRRFRQGRRDHHEWRPRSLLRFAAAVPAARATKAIVTRLGWTREGYTHEEKEERFSRTPCCCNCNCCCCCCLMLFHVRTAPMSRNTLVLTNKLTEMEEKRTNCRNTSERLTSTSWVTLQKKKRHLSLPHELRRVDEVERPVLAQVREGTEGRSWRSLRCSLASATVCNASSVSSCMTNAHSIGDTSKAKWHVSEMKRSSCSPSTGAMLLLYAQFR